MRYPSTTYYTIVQVRSPYLATERVTLHNKDGCMLSMYVNMYVKNVCIVCMYVCMYV